MSDKRFYYSWFKEEGKDAKISGIGYAEPELALTELIESYDYNGYLEGKLVFVTILTLDEVVKEWDDQMAFGHWGPLEDNDVSEDMKTFWRTLSVMTMPDCVGDDINYNTGCWDNSNY